MQGFAALVVVQLCFGLFPIFVKLANDSVTAGHGSIGPGGFDPRAIAFWRILTGALVLAPLVWRMHGRDALPRRSDLGRFALCALLGIAVNQVCALEGFARTSAVNAGLLFTLIPVFTYAVALIARQERFVFRRAIGIGIALCGATLLVLWRSGGGDAEYPEQLAGNLLIVLNCISYAAYLVLARPLLKRYSPLTVTMWIFVLSLWTLPLIAGGQDLYPQVISTHAWIGIGYTLIFATIVAYVLNTFALKRVSASTTAAFIYLQPLISGSAGVAFLGESITPAVIVAAALLLAGITLVLRSRVPLVVPEEER